MDINTYYWIVVAKADDKTFIIRCGTREKAMEQLRKIVRENADAFNKARSIEFKAPRRILLCAAENTSSS